MGPSTVEKKKGAKIKEGSNFLPIKSNIHHINMAQQLF
jgi:hypothetical protein